MYTKPVEDGVKLAVPMRERVARPLDIALSTVCVAGKNQADTLKSAAMYAAERRHRFPVPPTVDDVLRSNLTGALNT